MAGERYRDVEIAIQKELYQTLQKEGIDLSPEQFLKKIYGYIPPELLAKRHAEVEQAQYPRIDHGEPGNCLPKILEVSKMLKSVDAFLQPAAA